MTKARDLASNADGSAPTLINAKGDIIVGTADNAATRQAVGSNNQVLMADSAQTAGLKYAPEATATLTTTGDLLYASAANTLARRAIGSTGDVLTVSGGLPTWAAPSSGKVLQIVNATTTTATTIASTTFTDTTITATITPTSASSKIFIIVSAHFYHQALTVETMLGGRLLRGATVIADFDNELDQSQVTGSTAVYRRGNAPITWLDSPATTSATTYKVQGKVGNTNNSGSCTFQYNSIPSVITLFEVVA